MSEKIALVITSISKPDSRLRNFASKCLETGYDFILIGDEASPADFYIDGCRYFSLDAQRATDFDFARLCPTRHYARKNIGYLIARSSAATAIVETDDDNIPYPSFWNVPVRRQRISSIADQGWVNVYRYFSDAEIWPRGLPLNQLRNGGPSFDSLPLTDADCPIQQGLADENPDVDAIYRLTMPLPQSFSPDTRVALTSGTWCPFNSQNTVWYQDAFPLMYLPSYCSFRMTDIWRSFVAQRIAWTNDWSVLFQSPTVRQERNDHDLMRDFADEVPGYLNNAMICDRLGELDLGSGIERLGDNLRKCYECLVAINCVGAGELPLLEAWLSDLSKLG